MLILKRNIVIHILYPRRGLLGGAAHRWGRRGVVAGVAAVILLGMAFGSF